MYICKECGEVFEEPVVMIDDPSPSGVSLPAGAYEYETCPHCGSDDIGGASECVCCGEYYSGGGIICDECGAGIEEELEDIRTRNGLEKSVFMDVIAEIFKW